MITEKRSYAIRMITALSLSHACIDFLCAFSLYHHFSDLPDVFLIYNFCAFALQMPIGILIDYYNHKRNESFLIPALTTVIGIILTVTGSFLSPLMTGLGNACFHAGGGVLTIYEDRNNQMKGSGLGVFVAPGAIGLILGILYHDTAFYLPIVLFVSTILFILIYCLYRMRKQKTEEILIVFPQQALLKIVLCFIVVLLRSLTGMAVSFPWKTDNLITIVSVIALAFGKTAGGIIAARFGMKKTILVTLGISALAYIFAGNVFFGLIALFFFNMTMPLTLYLLAEELKGMSGFAFGILTFALFIGYLPVLYGYIRNVSFFPLGTIASVLSMIILLYYVRLHDEK